MPRKLKVTREKALEAAMYVFWARGYNFTSVNDLQKAMGLQRGSFYFHFKDKRALFIEVLDFYKQNVVEKRRAMVRASPSPKAGIHLYFNILFEHLTANKANSGCLNTNSSTELGLSDDEISEKLGLGMNGWKEFWVEILLAAKKKKEIPSSLNVHATAQLLVALTQGLNVVSRVNASPDFLRGIIRAGLAILD